MGGRAITLLTDFGDGDGYVAEMIGVLLSAVPDAQVISVSHGIPPQDVAGARLALSRYWRRFASGTVHLVIVDPGVGTSRAAIAVESDGRFLVGPDNGVLSPALAQAGAVVVQLDVPHGASPTFHGRDVFAPAAARLARGEPLLSLGRPHASPIVTPLAAPVLDGDGTIRGEVIAIDHFGNAITNLDAVPFDALAVAGALIPVVRTYGDVGVGRPCALVGSSGLIEVAVRNGSAVQVLGLAIGMAVRADPRRA